MSSTQDLVAKFGSVDTYLASMAEDKGKQPVRFSSSSHDRKC